MRIVGQPSSVALLLNALEKLRARVLILSTGFLSSPSDILNIAARRGIAVLVLAESTENAAQLMQLGVQGVIFRSANGNVVVEAVRRLSRGQPYMQSLNPDEGDVSEDLVGARVRDRLNDKELKIVAAVVQGYKNKEIAGQVYSTEQVIKNTLRNVFDKIGVSDRLELALFVAHHRMLAQATATATPPSTRPSIRQRPAASVMVPPARNNTIQ
jgi:DNA-binding NarL/FixJ family response regulator